MVENEFDDMKNVLQVRNSHDLDKCLKLIYIKKIDFKLNIKEMESKGIFYEIEMMGDEQTVEEVKRIAETILIRF